MSQEDHSLPGGVGSDAGLEIGLPLVPISKKQRGWDFPPAETDASFLFCIFKHHQGKLL